MPARSGFGEGSLFGSQTTTFSLCPHMEERESNLSLSLSLLIKPLTP